MNYFNSQNGDAVLQFDLREMPTDYKVALNFILSEFASKDGHPTLILHPALLLLVQMVRDRWGQAVSINSGYRSPAHNEAIGGASNSRHVMGMAVDLDVFNVPPDDVADYLQTLDVGGLGRYNTFTHVDVEGANRRWDNR